MQRRFTHWSTDTADHSLRSAGQWNEYTQRRTQWDNYSAEPSWHNAVELGYDAVGTVPLCHAATNDDWQRCWYQQASVMLPARYDTGQCWSNDDWPNNGWTNGQFRSEHNYSGHHQETAWMPVISRTQKRIQQRRRSRRQQSSHHRQQHHY